MSNQCPYCGSLRNVCVGSVSSRYVCLACEKFFHKGEQPKQTVFQRITASLEALAEKLVYCNVTVREYPGEVELTKGWYSTVIPKKVWSNEEEAIAATVAKLKEVAE